MKTKQWNGMPPDLSKNYLKINGSDVMEAWEDPIMHAMAQVVAENGGKVLEIGYGMGISAHYICQFPFVTDYVVCELNHHIAGQAGRDLARITEQAAQRGRQLNCTVIEGHWSDTKEAILARWGAFDGIFYDAYPVEEGEKGVHSLMFMLNGRELLKENGVLTYFTRQPNTLCPNQLAILLKLFKKVELRRVPVTVPADCSYFSGNNMVVVSCKGVGDLSIEQAAAAIMASLCLESEPDADANTILIRFWKRDI